MVAVDGTGREFFFDNNATTAPLPEVVEAVASIYRIGALNPSSVHSAGERARRRMEVAREQVADLVGALPSQLVFTSGATEANHLLLRNLFHGALRGFRFVTSEVEHSSVLQAARDLENLGHDVHILGVDSLGQLDPEVLADLILPGRTLVSFQWANNETGVIQPLSEIAQVTTTRNALLHTDATQAVGKIPVDLSGLMVDFLSLSAHKFHGPVGAGVLFVRNRGALRASLRGGDQESGLRPGTENVPAIVGMGIAATLRKQRLGEVARRMAHLRDEFESRLQGKGIVEAINGQGVDRLPNTSNIRFAGVDGEALVIRLDAAGIRCSQSSACTNRKPEPSYVLRAIGLSEAEAYRSVRFSLSEFTTGDDVNAVSEVIAELHGVLTKLPTLAIEA
jgi:cysteine desulfurase